jgi:hypothetical protein
MISRHFKPIFAVLALLVTFVAMTYVVPAKAQQQNSTLSKAATSSSGVMTASSTSSSRVNAVDAILLENHGAVVLAEPLGGRGALDHRLLITNLTPPTVANFTRTGFDALKPVVLKLPTRSLKSKRLRFVPSTTGRAGARDAVIQF